MQKCLSIYAEKQHTHQAHIVKRYSRIHSNSNNEDMNDCILIHWHQHIIHHSSFINWTSEKLFKRCCCVFGHHICARGNSQLVFFFLFLSFFLAFLHAWEVSFTRFYQFHITHYYCTPDVFNLCICDVNSFAKLTKWQQETQNNGLNAHRCMHSCKRCNCAYNNF